MKKTEIKKTALASLLCALAVVISVIGCVFDMADLASVSAASVIVAISARELGGKYPYLIYAVISVLLFLLFPSATVTFYFILFFGYYPIIRAFLAKIPKLPRYILKFSIFNVAAVSIYFIMEKLLLSFDTDSEVWLVPALWIVSNIFFAVFDFAMDIFIAAYIKIYRKKWGIDKFMLH